MAFVSYATTNIDRLVSLYKAAMDARRILVVDPYTAFVLDALGDQACLPQPEWNRNFRIWFSPGRHTDTIAASRELARFAKHKISTEEVQARRQRIVIRNIHATRTRFAAAATSADTVFVHSLWRGWLRDTEMAFWMTHDIEPCLLHSSGHAGRADLARFAAAFPGAAIVPIHTADPEAYRELFGDRCRLLADHEACEI
jgi:ribonuclease J